MVRLAEAAVAAFTDLDKRLFSLDKEKLVAENEWVLDEPLNVERVKNQFSKYDELVEDGRVQIPLHEIDSAELTGEYVEYVANTLIPCYTFKNESTRDRDRIPVDELSHTTLAERMRFWTADFKPSETPSYISTQNEPTTNMSTTTVVNPDEQAYEAESFFESVTGSIQEQRELQREQVRESYARLPFDKFLSKFGGVDGAVPLDSPNRNNTANYFKFVIPEAEGDIPQRFGLYPNNEILIDVTDFGRGRTPKEFRDTEPVEAEIQNVGGSRLNVTVFTERTNRDSLQALNRAFESRQAEVRILPLLNPIPFDREQRAIRTTRQNPEKRRIVVGNESITFSPQESVTADFEDLNDFQREAAIQAMRANDVSLIHGPPGTGKTRTLVELIRALVADGNRVLACAHSNQAIDNLIIGSSSLGDTDENSLHYDGLRDDISISRVGSGSRNDLVKANYGNINPLNADVVASTMSGAEKFSTDSFDVAVVDEASQASIASTLIPFNAAKKTILAGDHKQLPPYAANEMEQGEMEISLFEHLIERYGDKIRTMLQKQYRMNDQISAFPSKQFYDGMLESAEPNHGWTFNGLEPVLAFNCDSVEEQTTGKSYKNTVEATVVADQVDALLAFGAEPSEIGVITAYAGQISTIEGALDGIDGDTRNVKVDTIDSFQGSEREIILVSFVRSNEEGHTGFLSLPEEGQRRLNVALTRAKKRLVLIGNWDTLTSEQPDREDCSETYRALYSWLKENATVREYRPTKRKETASA